MGGVFITFEGLDGSGKSTQLERLAEGLERRGVAHVVTREPGGTPFADSLRELFLRREAAPADGVVELMLVFASRRSHLIEVVEPAVARGDVVLCDRFTDSSYAYQGGGRGVPPEAIAEADRLATGGRAPDRTLFFDLPPREAQRRRRGAAADRIDRESLAFYRRVHEAYQRRVAAEPERFRVIDATASIDDVARAVAAALADLIPTGEPLLAGGPTSSAGQQPATDQRPVVGLAPELVPAGERLSAGGSTPAAGPTPAAARQSAVGLTPAGESTPAGEPLRAGDPTLSGEPLRGEECARRGEEAAADGRARADCCRAAATRRGSRNCDRKAAGA